MNRKLVLGVSVFLALVGIAIVDGGKPASAGVGCRGCGGLSAGHARARCGGASACRGRTRCGGLFSGRRDRCGGRNACAGAADCGGADRCGGRRCGGRRCGGLFGNRSCGGRQDCCGVPVPVPDCCGHAHAVPSCAGGTVVEGHESADEDGAPVPEAPEGEAASASAVNYYQVVYRR